ncbi:MAG: hypothetical protein OQL16_02970 [Gammaproteobacteria bacterium]|nr:hypothetical protein [Gammaproteobacteria bacterium]
MEIDLNTKDTEEYKEWLSLLKEIRAIHEALQNEPNANGLKLARSLAYNILADIHALIDKVESDQSSSEEKGKDPLENLNLN